jgi:CHRD domain-containing protein
MRLRSFVLAVVAAALLPALALARGTAMSPQLHAVLAGKNEVPAGAPVGKGAVNVDVKAGNKVCWHFGKLTGIDAPVVAHIHKGKLKIAGPVVIPFGQAYKAAGCTTAAKKLIEAIETHPNDYYINVHTKKYPNGAVRGQLVAGMMKL